MASDDKTTTDDKKAAPKKSVAKKTTTKKAAKADKKPVVTKRASKKDLMAKHGKHAKDTGSAPVQIAILTSKIAELTEHLKIHPKDNHSRRGLLAAVGKRRKLLSYVKDKSKEAYNKVIAELGLRH